MDNNQTRHYWPGRPLNLTANADEGRSFAESIGRAASTNVYDCYQCGKCSGGCPVSFAMDLQPRQVMRLVQLGAKERVLKSSTIWLCASCQTCTTRCPREVRIAQVMDALREYARLHHYPVREKNMVAFHTAFLDAIAGNGRVHELGMVAKYKLKSGDYFSDIALGQSLFLKGKLSIAPHRSHNTAAIKKIFAKVRAMELETETHGEGGNK